MSNRFRGESQVAADDDSVEPGAGGIAAAPCATMLSTTPREQLLARWDPFCVTRNKGHCRSLSGHDGPTMTPPRASARGVDPYPGPDDDDDAMSLSSSAPVLEEARNCGSSQTQELRR